MRRCVGAMADGALAMLPKVIELHSVATPAYRREAEGDDGALMGMGGTRGHSALDSAAAALLHARPRSYCAFCPRRRLRASSRGGSWRERGAAARIAS
jgi:hypothetical protein